MNKKQIAKAILENMQDFDEIVYACRTMRRAQKSLTNAGMILTN